MKNIQSPPNISVFLRIHDYSSASERMTGCREHTSHSCQNNFPLPPV